MALGVPGLKGAVLADICTATRHLPQPWATFVSTSSLSLSLILGLISDSHSLLTSTQNFRPDSTYSRDDERWRVCVLAFVSGCRTSLRPRKAPKTSGRNRQDRLRPSSYSVHEQPDFKSSLMQQLSPPFSPCYLGLGR
jgi:hypothetical protein